MAKMTLEQATLEAAAKQNGTFESSGSSLSVLGAGTGKPVVTAIIPSYSLPVTDKPLTSNVTKDLWLTQPTNGNNPLPLTTPLIVGDVTPLPLNTTSNSSTMDTLKDYDLVVNVPAPGTQTPAQLEAAEAAKRQRYMWIGGGILLALIVLIIVLSRKK